jgi:hypothetical protein
MIDVAEVWSLVKPRLNLPDDTHKLLADLYIAEIGQRILHYINQRQMPDALLHTWAAMAASAMAAEQQAILYPVPEPEEVQELSVGDTSVKSSYVKKAAPPFPTPVALDKVIADYSVDLRRHRRMGW